MASDDYDKYDDKFPSKKRGLIDFLKIGKRNSPDYCVFQWAGAAWVGMPDGSVDRNPMCITCETQLSFIDKDIVICDTCHKYRTKEGEFHFTVNDKPVSFESAYRSAQRRWQELLKTTETP
ncbi:MAG: hypothetical protein RBU23_05525 [Candidatus Auribacterota bacterium]|nr:hypothetical protein [Candidatus Auribacterota bacterium]